MLSKILILVAGALLFPMANAVTCPQTYLRPESGGARPPGGDAYLGEWPMATVFSSIENSGGANFAFEHGAIGDQLGVKNYMQPLRGRAWATWTPEDWELILMTMGTIQPSVDRTVGTGETQARFAQNIEAIKCYQAAAAVRVGTNNKSITRGPGGGGSERAMGDVPMPKTGKTKPVGSFGRVSEESGTWHAGQSGKTRKADNHCLKASHNKDGSLDLLNVCRQRVVVAYCYTQAEDGSSKADYVCRPQKSEWAVDGIDYATQWPGAVEPGKTMNIAWDPKSTPYRVTYLGCLAPYVFPVITSYVPGGDGKGYCRRTE